MKRATLVLLCISLLPYSAAADESEPLMEGEGSSSDSESGDDTLLLGDLRVSGERFERSVSQTASSVDVTTAEELNERAGSDSVRSVLELVPNVSVGDGTGHTIRGQDTNGALQGADAFLGGSRPRATIQVDGRPVNFNQYVYGTSELWDVKQVEVFRGPQTTTQGANSIAGAIFVETNDPSFELESAVRGILAEDDTQQGSLMVSGPLLEDQLAARIAFDYRTHNSFVNFSNPDPNVGEERDIEETVVGRAKLLFEPTALPGLSTQLTFSVDQFQGAQVELVDRVPDLGISFEDRVSTRETDYPIFEVDSTSIVHDISYEFENEVTAKNTFSYSEIKMNRSTIPRGQGFADIDGDEWVNETILSYESKSSPFSGLVGNYARGSDDDEFIDLSAFIGEGNFDDKKFSHGIFTEVTYAATDRLDLTAGVRYQRDSQERRGSLGMLAVDFDETFDAVLPKFVAAYQVNKGLRVGASVTKGYNPGGTTVSFVTGQQDLFAEEEVWNYELFTRASWLEDRLQVNANVFYADYKDLQRAVTTEVNEQFVTELDNAEDAYGLGAEFEVSYTPVENLTLVGALGLLKTELEEYSISAQPVVGNEFNRAPSMTASARVLYEPIENLDFSLQGRYSDRYFSDDINDPTKEVASYFIADAQLSYTYKQLRMFVFATNIFDKFNVSQVYFDTALVGNPREVGLGFEWRI